MTKVLRSPFLTKITEATSDAGVADDQPPGLEDDLAAERARMAGDDLGIGVGEGRRIVVDPVGDAEAAAEIDMVDRMAVGAQGLHEVGEQREGVVERLEVGDLRTDMHVDAPDREAGEGARPGEHLAGARDRHAELVLRLAGRDLGVGAGVDIRIDADGDRGDRAARRGDRRQRLELGLGFDIEAEDVLVEPEGHLGPGLADAGEDDPVAGHAGGAGAAELALADHVHAGAEVGERLDDRLVRVGLHRIGDERALPGEGRAEHLEVPLDGGARIAVERRADRAGDLRQGDVLGGSTPSR